MTVGLGGQFQHAGDLGAGDFAQAAAEEKAPSIASAATSWPSSRPRAATTPSSD
ncbi:hypothetical protein JOS77_17915 [Chromobacterium haemolyticum]|nr:hypothetical protein JOS77_17915 [Chromobacterium haemolyticum]